MIHLRALSPKPSTLNAEARTVEAIVSTGADAPRPGFIERLNLKGADLSRLIGGPVLDGHQNQSTRDQLGVIEAAEVRPEGLWARIKFRSNEAARAVVRDIADGTLRGLSVGYSVQKWRETTEGGQTVRTAEKWTPVEVSIVPIPADPAAHFRNGEYTMPNNETQSTVETTTETATRADANREIRSLATLANLGAEWANAQIDAEATVEAARAAAFEAMAQRQNETRTRSARVEIGTDHTAPDVVATRAGEALFARANPTHEISAAARQYAGLTIPDLARDCLRRSGISTTGATVDTLVTRALHTTSDFPLILGDAVNRELRKAYQAAPSGIKQIARQTTARDFRAKSAVMLGEGPELEKVNEGGEYKYGTIAEGAESYKVETFGKIFSISRQALINDDLGAFTRVPAMLGQAAAAFEAKTLAGLIEANPTMSDGNAVFSEAHANVTEGSVVGKLGLSAARLLLRNQTGLGGGKINATPRFVLVSPERETEAEQALAEITATTTDAANPFAGLGLIVDGYLSESSPWYMAADPAVIDTVEYAYLEGAPGPQIESKAGFEVDGMSIKVRLDFGAGWVDHRGMVKNPGAESSE
ncbi:prohead protease/major capsid protein fusion protein [Celeribacter halophilus]|uniref:Phage prohead protease, HK97 family n=1 Tax=Celeribacter halophilus TaxID=576117 RepID=A0A1I3NPS5_9RHOB|nr:prohead protease/major capsid protein fusion protein [Celeribacter halophilus]PZX14597.1 HK97 family phage prohead protease [Celeribacter halophilus]SFJ11313.1 phage prohead protease, HK97 family [Celeribacter halophilus]